MLVIQETSSDDAINARSAHDDDIRKIPDNVKAPPPASADTPPSRAASCSRLRALCSLKKITRVNNSRLYRGDNILNNRNKCFDPVVIMTKEGKVDIDAILAQLGEFGPYQVKTYCLILLPIMFSAVYNSQFIFAAGATDYRLDYCKSREIRKR